MKKSTKISLLVSLALVVAGAVIVFISLLGVDFDMRKFSNMAFEKKVYNIEESFDNIHINNDNDDMELYLSDDETCRIVCYESEKIYYECVVDDSGELRINERDDRKWYEKIGFFYKENEKIQIYLPEQGYKEIYAHSVNGDVNVAKELVFEAANLHTVNGKINLNADVTQSVSVETTNGDLNLNGEINGNIHAGTVNGKITAKHIINAVRADFATTNGNIELNGHTAVYLYANSTNGSIKFTAMVSDKIDMETVNGSITGTVISNKTCVGRSTNGSVNVPNRVDNNGDFYFKTVNGNIDVKEK